MYFSLQKFNVREGLGGLKKWRPFSRMVPLATAVFSFLLKYVIKQID